jgi:hypothetical protein
MNTKIMILAILTLSGCINIGPKNNLKFSEIENLNQLSGTYKNRGEPQGALSAVILGGWSVDSNVGQEKIQHSDIELLQVSTTDNNITVGAIRHGCVVYSREFVLHRDFEISNGKVLVSRKMALLTQGAGDVLIGPRFQTIEIGLDTGQNGKYQETGGMAGLVFMLIPIALYGHSDIRFERIHNDAVYKECKSR